MVTLSRLAPLQHNVRLTNPDGTPTPYFTQLLETLLQEKAETDELAEGALGNLMSTDRILGRDTAGDGVVEQLTLSQILDFIGSAAQGDILFRGAANWSRLAAGAAGKILTAHGAADPTWETAATSGAPAYERTRVIPLASGYTIQNAGASYTITDTAYGMWCAAPSGGTEIRMVRKNGAPPSTPYSIISRADPGCPHQGGGYNNCIILRNNTSGRILISGHYNGDYNYLIQKWNSYSSYSADLRGPTFWPQMAGLRWQKMTNDGTNLTWYLSPDGVNWVSVTTTTLANFITATGGTLDQIGFGSFLSSGAENRYLQQSFEAV